MHNNEYNELAEVSGVARLRNSQNLSTRTIYQPYVVINDEMCLGVDYFDYIALLGYFDGFFQETCCRTLNGGTQHVFMTFYRYCWQFNVYMHPYGKW